jgi:hypothetical protein
MQERLVWLENNAYIQNNKVVHTRTTRFLMPLIGISEFSLGYINPKLFINAHLKSYEEKLIILILNKVDCPEGCKEYIELQNLNENFVDYIEEEQEYILIYKLPNHFYDDYDKILKGMYSKTSGSYKDIICKIYGTGRIYNEHYPSVYDCLEPTKEKRKLYADFLGVDISEIKEVSSIPDPNYEIYKTIKQLKE